MHINYTSSGTSGARQPSLLKLEQGAKGLWLLTLYWKFFLQCSAHGHLPSPLSTIAASFAVLPFWKIPSFISSSAWCCSSLSSATYCCHCCSSSSSTSSSSSSSGTSCQSGASSNLANSSCGWSLCVYITKLKKKKRKKKKKPGLKAKRWWWSVFKSMQMQKNDDLYFKTC